jgi:threonyl-tRNA synthetase
MITVRAPGREPVGLEEGGTVLDALRRLGLDAGAVAAEAEGRTLELSAPLPPGEELTLHPLTFEDPRGRLVPRHTGAHVLAQAVKRLWPETRLGTGPATEEGFHYDLLPPVPLGPEELARIEAEMRRIIAEDLPVVRQVVDREEARALFRARGEPFKLELIEGLPEGAVVTVYRQGEFVDLCRGPHVPSTGYVGVVRLTHVAGAYWRGDESRPMLQRVYGTAFPSEEALAQHLERLEEARRRDHRRLGRELGLFDFEEDAPGFPFYLPHGTVMLGLLEQLMRRLQVRAGYQEVRTPQILPQSLWQRSGHWEIYREHMYLTRVPEGEFAIKPMNCPGAVLIYRRELRSYRDLPLRLAEFGRDHRYERSGTLHGIMRAREILQDDAHLFTAPEDLGAEIGRVLDLVDRVYALFGLPYRVELSTRPEPFIGEIALWDQAEQALARVLEERGQPYAINPGDGAFYGPKIDFHVQDSLGRTWQCGTVQLDFQFPLRFDLTYVGADGGRHRPVMIHRAVLGSLNRFLGILVEHYGGSFPTWLSPVQVRLLPVAPRHLEAAERAADRLRAADLRPEVDRSDEKLGKKIRSAQLSRVPYMGVIGDREAEADAVALRTRQGEDLGPVPLEALIARLQGECRIDGVGLIC